VLLARDDSKVTIDTAYLRSTPDPAGTARDRSEEESQPRLEQASGKLLHGGHQTDRRPDLVIQEFNPEILPKNRIILKPEFLNENTENKEVPD